MTWGCWHSVLSPYLALGFQGSVLGTLAGWELLPRQGRNEEPPAAQEPPFLPPESFLSDPSGFAWARAGLGVAVG